MELEDYMKNIKSEKEKPNWAKFYYELDTFNIDSEKLKLLDSLRKYLKSYSYCADLDFYRGQTETFAQIQTTTGGRMIVQIDLMEYSYYDDGEYMSSHRITEEEYYKRLHTYKRIGSQKINWVFINMPFTSNRSVTLYYSLDDHFFIDKKNVEYLNDAIIEDFGASLGNIALNSSDNSIKQEKKINSQLETRHKLNLIDNYSFQNDELYLNKKLVKKIY